MEIKKLLQRNLQQASRLPMPKNTYATLNKQGEYAYLSVAPGIINKHFTSEQLMVLAQAAKNGTVKYSAGHTLLLTIPKEEVTRAIKQLTEVELYLVPAGTCAVLKCCDFCDGERMEALPLLKEMLQKIEGRPSKKRLRIGFNACAKACYNAVYDDIALIYHEGHVDILAGAVQMGRHAKPRKLLIKKVPEALITMLVQKLIDRYSVESDEKEEFAVYIKRHLELSEWLEKVLLLEKQLHV
jgi:precorrin-3B C17-methyltransferase